VLIDAPDNLPAYIVNSFRSEIERHRERLIAIVRLNQERGTECLKRFVHYPTVRQSAYRTPREQWIVPGFDRHAGVDDPPVMMRGCRAALHKKFSKSPYHIHRNGWHERVAERYLRMIRFTHLAWNLGKRGSDRRRAEQAIENIDRKFGCHGFENPARLRGAECWIDGRYYLVGSDQRPVLASLMRHIKKITNIRSAMEKVAAVDHRAAA